MIRGETGQRYANLEDRGRAGRTRQQANKSYIYSMELYPAGQYSIIFYPTLHKLRAVHYPQGSS